MSNQLRGILVTRLGKVNFEADPQRGPFLAIASVQIIRRVDELSGCESRFNSPSPPCSSGSNCCSQMLRSVVTAGSVFSQSAVLEASIASSSVHPSAPT